MFRLSLVGILTACCVGSIGAIAFTLDDQAGFERCTEAWRKAGPRVDDRLSDEAATPILAMMMASRYAVPADGRIVARDYVAACHAGAIW